MSGLDLALAGAGLVAAPGLGAGWLLLRPRSEGVLGSRMLEGLLVGPILSALALHGLLLGGQGPRPLAALGFVLLAITLARRPWHGPWLSEGCRTVVLIAPAAVALWFATSTAPLVGDPADLWAAKAAAFKISGALDLSPLGSGEVLARRNPFHPLGLPLLMNQALAWFPQFEPTLCRLPSVYFLAVLLLLCDRALASRFAPWPRVLPVLALGFLPPVLAQGHDGHADLAVGVLALAAWLVALTGGSVVLAGVLAGGAGLIKLEGQAAWGVAAVLLVLAGRWRSLPWFALCAAPILAVGWLVRPAGLEGQGPAALVGLEVYLGDPGLLFGRLARIANAFGRRALDAGWPWQLWYGACGLTLCLGRGRPVSWSLLLAAAAWLSAVAYAYLRHPNFEWQLEVHHRRALVQVLPALWIAGSLALGQGLPPRADAVQ